MSNKRTKWQAMTDGLPSTKPSTHATPKDVYVVELNGKRSALCLSCCVGRGVEFKQRKKDDWVVERPCQGTTCQEDKQSEKQTVANLATAKLKQGKLL